MFIVRRVCGNPMKALNLVLISTMALFKIKRRDEIAYTTTYIYTYSIYLLVCLEQLPPVLRAGVQHSGSVQ